MMAAACFMVYTMKTIVSLSLNPEICASLDRAAASEERSRNQFAERLIRAALASRQSAESATEREQRA